MISRREASDDFAAKELEDRKTSMDTRKNHLKKVEIWVVASIFGTAATDRGLGAVISGLVSRGLLDYDT